MADLSSEFNTFHDRITLTFGKKDSLRKARNALRDKIRGHFRDQLKLNVPKFRGQGSYAMGTTVNPLDGEFDIDDGVYMQHLDPQDDTEWPLLKPFTVGWFKRQTVTPVKNLWTNKRVYGFDMPGSITWIFQYMENSMPIICWQ